MSQVMNHDTTASARELLQKLSAARLEDVGEGFWEVGFRALGSDCELFFAANDQAAAQAYVAAAFAWLAAFEAKFSRYRGDSLTSLINANAGVSWTEIDAETDLLLDLCDNAHFVTRGAFDATSLPLSQLWDWKRKHDSLPSAAEVEAAKSLVAWKNIQRDPGRIFLPTKGMMLDFGGVGKEFAVDCLAQLGTAHGLVHLMVDLGGDIAVRGEPPEGGGWYVGLEDPADNDKCYCGVRLKHGAAVATSGDYRRFFHLDGLTFGHIIDSRTGWPVANGTRAVTVIAPRCTAAGLLSTSAMVLGGSDAIAMLEGNPGVQGCLWHQGRLHETRGFRRNVLPQGWDDDNDSEKS